MASEVETFEGGDAGSSTTVPSEKPAAGVGGSGGAPGEHKCESGPARRC